MSESGGGGRTKSVSGTITFVMIAGEPWTEAQEGVVRFDWHERRKGSLTTQVLRITVPGMQVVIGPEDLEDKGGI